MSIPNGATHQCEAYGIVTYYKRSQYAIGPESGQPLMAWFSWTGKEWARDSGINTDRLTEIK